MLLTYPLISFFTNDPSIVDLTLKIPIKFWFYILIFEIFAITIPNLLFYFGVRKVSASDAGIITLLETVSASLLAFIFLGQTLTVNTLFGGTLILLANYLAIKEEG